MAASSQASSFTGRSRRRRRASAAVRWADGLARALITAGGMGTIAAILLVCVFLAWVVVPLFESPAVLGVRHVGLDRSGSGVEPLHLAVDEHLTTAVLVDPGGRLVAYRLDTGERIIEREVAEGREVTAASFSEDSGNLALGFEDGTIRIGRIGFETEFLSRADAPEALRALGPGQRASHEGAVVVHTRGGRLRAHRLSIEMQEPIEPETASAVEAIDMVVRNAGPVYVMLTEDGRLRLRQARKQENLLTGEVSFKVRGSDLPYEAVAEDPPRFLKLAGLGDNVYVGWEDGRLVRFDTRDLTEPRIAERLDLVPEESEALTSLSFLIGRTTLIAGDSLGRMRAWFRIKPPRAGRTEAGETLVRADRLPLHAAEPGLDERLPVPEAASLSEALHPQRANLRVLNTSDGAILAAAHGLGEADTAVTDFAASSRSRLMVTGHGGGRVRLIHATTEQVLLNLPSGSAAEGEGPVRAVALAPKDNAVVRYTDDGLDVWRIDPGHPAASLGSIFGKVWYEGYPRPAHVWQSSAGTDQFEPKFGLMPLIFGTIKGTIYCMLFGLPLALAAAVYSSEFLPAKTKAKVKPTIEMMASLPTVVLGFLAALVFARYAAGWLPVVLAVFYTLPLALLVGGYGWQLLPRGWVRRLEPWRFWFIAAMIAPALAAALGLGPAAETWLFAGDVNAWLDGQVHTRFFGIEFGGLGGWVMLLTPVAAVSVAIGLARWVNPWLHRRTRHLTRERVALLEMGKFLLTAAATLGLALVLGLVLTLLGFDARGHSLFPPDVMSTYIQRNALVVGFTMGFAVIPIIYTIAEDALSAVPEHLRAGSLATGATPWQTAVRIVIPTAMSGLFSAVMIGLGRAVGETMIVLMAAGNTPVMQWNIFNGFRTLSANIAVELPEAPVDSTHYRMLFLAALVLFAMTFAINTVAEVVRLRFRRRAYQL